MLLEVELLKESLKVKREKQAHYEQEIADPLATFEREYKELVCFSKLPPDLARKPQKSGNTRARFSTSSDKATAAIAAKVEQAEAARTAAAEKAAQSEMELSALPSGELIKDLVAKQVAADLRARDKAAKAQAAAKMVMLVRLRHRPKLRRAPPRAGPRAVQGQAIAQAPGQGSKKRPAQIGPQSRVSAVSNPVRVRTPDHILDRFGRKTVGWLTSHLTLRPVHFVGFPEGPPAWLQTLAASRLLARGAKFIPTPRMTGVCDIGQAFDRFARSTHLRLYFGDTPMDKHTRQFRVPNPGWQLPRHVRDSVEHRNLAAHLSLLKQRLLSTYERAVWFCIQVTQVQAQPLFNRDAHRAVPESQP